ncbi:MAG: hypothetical protein IJD78_02585 [Clostridia bacterium]|nr:hypothetical protein [Clostridia bacterium]
MKEKRAKKYIALAVFLETSVNIAFAFLFEKFINVFYSDYAHLTIWGDVVSIVSVVFSFVIYDSFAHKAYHMRKDRIMFLGAVYVASKAASIIHYSVAILAEIFPVATSEISQFILSAFLILLEIVVDVIAAVWLIGYLERKFSQEEE